MEQAALETDINFQAWPRAQKQTENAQIRVVVSSSKIFI